LPPNHPAWRARRQKAQPDAPGASPRHPCACEDRRPSLNVDAQTHQTAEQDAHVASAALLEGEEKRTLSVSSEQAAAPGTPSTSNTQVAAAPLLKGEELWGMDGNEQRAGCCAGHPLNFKLTARHAC